MGLLSRFPLYRNIVIPNLRKERFGTEFLFNDMGYFYSDSLQKSPRWNGLDACIFQRGVSYFGITVDAGYHLLSRIRDKFCKQCPEGTTCLSGRTLRPHNAENILRIFPRRRIRPAFAVGRLNKNRAWSKLTLMLCFLFICTLARAENLLNVGLVNQQFAHFVTYWSVLVVEIFLLGSKLRKLIVQAFYR